MSGNVYAHTLRASAGRLGALIVKELLSYLRDPRTRVILVAPPLIQLLVFSFALTLEARNVDVVVLDEDSGSLSTDFIAALAASSFIGNIAVVHDAPSLESAIDSRAALVAVRLPADFSGKILTGDIGTAQVLLDGRRSNAAQLTFSYISTIANGIGARHAAAVGIGPPVRRGIETRHWFNPSLSYRWFIVPGLSGVLALLIALLITALSIARERELGTFDQLLVSPVTPTEIIIGKSIPALLIGAALGALMILAGIILFRIPFTGSVPMLALTLSIFILGGVGIGLAVSAVCQTQQQAILGAFALIVPIVLTSGFATPVSNMPEWLQAVSLANPLRHYLVVVQGSFLKALPPSEVLSNTLPLIAIAFVTLGFATWIVRARLQ